MVWADNTLLTPPMRDLVFYSLIVPLELLLILWAAFVVIGIKGLLFHRKPHRKPRPTREFVNPDTGEVFTPQGLGLGWTLCLLFVCWPLFLASKIDEWLAPPKDSG